MLLERLGKIYISKHRYRDCCQEALYPVKPPADQNKTNWFFGGRDKQCDQTAVGLGERWQAYLPQRKTYMHLDIHIDNNCFL